MNFLKPGYTFQTNLKHILASLGMFGHGWAHLATPNQKQQSQSLSFCSEISLPKI